VTALDAPSLRTRHADTSSLGPARFDFADERDVDRFVEKLARFERGELSSDEWRAFRLVNGAYGQRQEGDSSMLRVKLPQGIVTTTQVEALARVAERHGRGFVHVTTRQNVQYHFLRLGEVGEVLSELAAAGLTTREACGNSVRNVTTSPTAGVANDEVFDPVPYAEALTRYLLRHPLSSTLPRKFKIAFSGGGADHSYAAVNDLGFHARRADDGSRGFRLTVAGGTAILCRTGHELGSFVPAGEVLAWAEAVLRVFHREGDRVHRHKNRMKFLVKALGWEAFRTLVLTELERVRAEGAPPLPFDPELPPYVDGPPNERAARPTRAEVLAKLDGDAPKGPGLVPRALPIAGDDHGARFLRSNVAPQRQAGFSLVTVTLPLGDVTAGQLRVLALLAAAYGDGALRFTVSQNALLRWVPDELVVELQGHLRAAGLGEPDAGTVADVASCPGAESCKLAVTQSRGAAQAVGDALRAERSWIDRAPGLDVRVSGCPNGCGLHHVSAVGLQGGLRKVGGRPAPHYTVYVGGLVGSDARFGRVAGKVPARRVADALRALIELYEEHRQEGERADAFFARAPLDLVKARLAPLEALDEGSATEADFVDLGETTAFRPEASEGECAA
jgi:sulfite reductase beta subunit-like hemoprotein